MSAIARTGAVLPVLQLTRRGAVWHDHDRGVARLREEFRRRHVVRLPALLEPALLAQIQREIEAARFQEYVHDDEGTQLCMTRNACEGLLHFLVNDRSLYRLVEDVSEQRPVRFFYGRVYRRLPNRRGVSWHSDLTDGRLVGMSVNLGAQAYEGGVLEIRDANTEQPLASLVNVDPGDAILFRLASTLQHRVTDVRGAFPKTAFAGWFRSTPDYLAAFAQDPFMAEST